MLLLSAPADVYVPCLPAEAALESVGEAYGVKMAPSGGVRKDVLYLRWNGKTLEQAKEALAFATDGEWREQDDTWFLVSEEKSSADQAFEQLKALLEGVEVPPAFTAATAEEALLEQERLLQELGNRAALALNKVNVKGPDARLMARLAKMIGPERLASIPEDTRVIFVANPVGLQRALPREAMQAIEDYRQEAALLNQVVEEKAFRSRIESSFRTLASQQFGPAQPPYFLEVSRTEFALQMAVKGYREAPQNSGLYRTLAQQYVPLADGGIEKSEIPTFLRQALKVSEPTQEAIDQMELADRGLPVEMDPIRNFAAAFQAEPLQKHIAPMLDQIPEEVALNVSDQSLMVLTLVPGDQVDLGLLLQAARSEDLLTLEGGLVAARSYALAESRARFERASTADFAAKAIDAAAFPAREFLSWLRMQPDGMAGWQHSVLITQATGWGRNPTFAQSSQYGGLDVVRLAAEAMPLMTPSGEDLAMARPFSQLPKEVKDLVTSLAFSEYSRISEGVAGLGGSGFVRVQGPADDPYRVIPNGPPANSILKINITGAPSLFVQRSTERGSNIQNVRTWPEVARIARSGGTGVLQTQALRIDISILLDGQRGVHHFAEIAAMPRNASFTGFAELTGEMKKEYEKAKGGGG